LPPPPDDRQPARPSPSAGIWDLARGLNRADRTAVALAAEDGPSPFAVDGLEVRRLLGTFWFRSVFHFFSPPWRERLFSALVSDVIVPNHYVRLGRELTQLKDLRHEQIKAIADRPLTHADAGADLRLLIAIGNLWGADAIGRLRFGDIVNSNEPSRLATLWSGLRQ
jgi:hypothetical protein